MSLFEEIGVLMALNASNRLALKKISVLLALLKRARFGINADSGLFAFERIYFTKSSTNFGSTNAALCRRGV